MPPYHFTRESGSQQLTLTVMLQTLPPSMFLLVLIVTPVSRSAPPDTASLSQTSKESPLPTRRYWGLARETGKGTEEKECIGLWQREGKNGTCECGAQIHGAVYCENFTVSVLDCFCMTEESTTGQMVVGNCIYNCLNLSKKTEYSDFFYHPVPSLCDYLHRTGTLCGQCNYTSHHFPPAYSYDVKCVKCEQSHSVWLYIAVAFLPLTVFIVVILVFRVNAVCPKLHAFVCFAQIAGAPIQVRIILLSTTHTGTAISEITRILTSLYGFWNLDFFRTLIPGVCLHLTTMQVLALDYLIAVYPMALICPNRASRTRISTSSFAVETVSLHLGQVPEGVGHTVIACRRFCHLLHSVQHKTVQCFFRPSHPHHTVRRYGR